MRVYVPGHITLYRYVKEKSTCSLGIPTGRQADHCRDRTRTDARRRLLAIRSVVRPSPSSLVPADADAEDGRGRGWPRWEEKEMHLL